MTAGGHGGPGTDAAVTAAFVLTLPAGNAAPTDIALDADHVTENEKGWVVGNLSVTDPDAGDSHTLAVNDARFEIVGGQLKLKDGVALDFEATPTVSVEVTATDAGGLSHAETFVITVDDMPDTATPGNDLLVGSSGNDVIDGLAGHDEIYGLGGDDKLTGGAGNDELIGGTGDNLLDGGTASGSVDILDFSDFVTGTFAFLDDETHAFDGAGDTQARFNDQTNILEIDADGDAQTDMEIELTDTARRWTTATSTSPDRTCPGGGQFAAGAWRFGGPGVACPVGVSFP